MERERSFDTPGILKEGAISLLCLALLLAGVEAVLRTNLAVETLPVPLIYYSYDVPRKLHALDRLQQAHGPIDVMFLGSSVTRADFMPTLFDAVVRKRTGRAMLSYNAGLSTMFPTGAVVLFEHVWLSAARPRYLLQGVREAELASRQTRPFYLKNGRVEWPWVTGDRVDQIEGLLLEHLHLLQYRGTLYKAIDRWSHGERLNQRERGELTADARGHRDEKQSLQQKRKHHSPRLWRYKHPPQADRYQQSLPALERMHELCKANGIQYVLVHLPEHPDRFDTKDGPAVWADYEARITAWAAARHIPFIDASGGQIRTFASDEYYSDYHHMSPRGARVFTQAVAERFAELIGKHGQVKPKRKKKR